MGTKLEISDEILWGKLVKSWATGENYIVRGRPAPPIPRTLADLLEYRSPTVWWGWKSSNTAGRPW